MTWSEALYWYWKDRGGALFGLYARDHQSSLVLPGPGGDVLLRTEPRSSNQYQVYYSITASLPLTLERPYSLRISPESTLRGGLNAVLDQVDRGVARLGGSHELYQDYDLPQLDRRRVKGDDPGFTRLVLGSLALRRGLEANPRCGLEVGPAGPGSREHLAVVWMDEEKAGLPEDDVWIRAEERQSLFAGCGFSQTMDDLVSLVRALRDAVTAWPMPPDA